MRGPPVKEIPSGIIIVNKPADITSARVVSLVKRRARVRKAGHAGTLDPFATGVMLCLVNKATRLAGFFLRGEKTYDATMLLGVETDTQDFTGKVIGSCEVPEGAFADEDILRAIKNFEGEGFQEPPSFSAVKHQGTPLYRLARKGVFVKKPARRIFISSLQVLDIDLPYVRFEVTCSGGTYVRTLCADIGRELGCGGHLVSLTRTMTGGFGLDRAAEPDDLEPLDSGGVDRAWFVPMEEALPGIPKYRAPAFIAEKVAVGGRLPVADLAGAPEVGPDGHMQIVDREGRLLAVVQRAGDIYRYCCVFAG